MPPKSIVTELNKIYNLDIIPKELTISSKKCILTELKLGLGELLWKDNL